MGLSVTQVFSTAFSMLRQRFLPLLGLWAIFAVLMGGALFLFGGATIAAGMSGENPEAMGAGMILATMVFYLLYFLLSFAQSAAMTHHASSLHEPALGDSLSTGVRSAPSLLGAYVLLFIAYIIAAIPLALLFGVLAMAGPAVVVVLVILIVPLVIWLACRLSMLVPVVAVERVTNPINALSRTWTMTKGNSLSIFVVFLVFAIAAMVVLLILAAPLIGAIMASANEGTPPDFTSLGMGSLAGLFVASVLLGLISPCIIAAIHAALARHLDQDTPEVFS